MTIYMSQFYISENEQRNEELYLCYKINITNKKIDRFIWFIYDEFKDRIPDWLTGEKIILQKEWKFEDVFNISGENNLYIVSNSDIIITEDAVDKINTNLKKEEVYCITRWNCDISDKLNLEKAEFYKSSASQDTWCWIGKMDCFGDIRFGVPGCDNRIAYEFSRIKKVINPALTIKTLHVHTSNFRTYMGNGKVKGKKITVKPIKI